MEIEQAIRQLVERIVREYLGDPTLPEPELIRIEDAAKICGCDRSTINALIQDAAENGFPVVRLSTRTIRIDKHRLGQWLRAGGLNEKMSESNDIASFSDWKKKNG